MPRRPVFCFLIFLLLWAIAAVDKTALGGSNDAAVAKQASGGLETLSIQNGRVTMGVRDVPLTKLLGRLAEIARIDLVVDPGIDETVTLTFDGISLEEAIKELCRNRAMIYQYIPETNTYRIIGLSAQKRQSASDGAATDGKTHSQGPFMAEAVSTGGKAIRPSNAPENLCDSRGRPLYKPRELLVKFKKGSNREEALGVHRTLGSSLIKANDHRNLHRVRIRDGLTVEAAADLYRASPLVERTERNALRYPDDVLPNDTYFGLQWGLHNTGQFVNGTYGRPDADIDAPEAWEIIDRGKEVVIAVIDTGVDYNHPDLAGRIWTNPGEVPGNGIDDDKNGYIDDVRGWDFADGDNDPVDRYGHGTHVAGIIAAGWNNAAGIAGIFPKAKLMLLKVSTGSSADMDTFDIVSALDYARANGAHIVNGSYGGSAAEPDEYEAFADLKNAAILAACAAGNSGRNVDVESKTYPASYAHSTNPSYPPLDNIISVAASTPQDALSGNSNYGLNSVDLMAPGYNIYSTCLNSTYCYKDGTSMATPQVSAVAGLVLSRTPHLTYLQVKDAILNNVDVDPNPVWPVSGKLITGGRLNAFKALSAIHLPGDVNGDHKVDLADVIACLRILSGFQPSLSWTPADDVDRNTAIGMAEALYILQWMAELRDGA